MRELRINLPDELWDKFQGQSPQQMKSAISTVICLQFQVKPEPKQRKRSNTGHPHRGTGGRFTGKAFSDVAVPLQAQETVNNKKLAQVTLEPQTPRENTVHQPETPLEIMVQQPESQPRASESKVNPIKIDPFYAVGLQA